MNDAQIAEDDCPLLDESDPDTAVTNRQFNLAMRRFGYFRFYPLRKEVSAMSVSLEAHLEQCALRQAAIMGGLLVIKVLIGLGLFMGLTAWVKFMTVM